MQQQPFAPPQGPRASRGGELRTPLTGEPLSPCWQPIGLTALQVTAAGCALELPTVAAAPAAVAPRTSCSLLGHPGDALIAV